MIMDEIIRDAAVELCNLLKGGGKQNAQDKPNRKLVKDIEKVLYAMVEQIGESAFDDDDDAEEIIDPSERLLQDMVIADLFYVKSEDEEGNTVYDVATQDTVATMLAEIADEGEPIQRLQLCMDVNCGFAFVLPNMENPGTVDLYATKTYEEAERLRNNLRKREGTEFGEEKQFFPEKRLLS
jgi:hypothetical protein